MEALILVDVSFCCRPFSYFSAEGVSSLSCCLVVILLSRRLVVLLSRYLVVSSSRPLVVSFVVSSSCRLVVSLSRCLVAVSLLRRLSTPPCPLVSVSLKRLISSELLFKASRLFDAPCLEIIAILPMRLSRRLLSLRYAGSGGPLVKD